MPYPDTTMDFNASDPSVPLTDDQVKRANLNSNLFRDYAIPGRVQLLETSMDLVDRAADALTSNTQNAAIATSTLVYSQNPTAGDKLSIGANVYEFVATGGDLSNDAYIGVVLDGENPDVTYANLVAAINATSATNEHEELFKTDSTTPAKANGTENVVAYLGTGNNTLYIQNADAPGGTPVAGDGPALALSATDLTEAIQFSPVTLNLALASAEPVLTKQAHFKHTVIAGDLSALQPRAFWLPFEPVAWQLQIFNAAGALVNRYVEVEALTPVGDINGLAVNLLPSVPGGLLRVQTFNIPLKANGISEVSWQLPEAYRITDVQARRGTNAIASAAGTVLLTGSVGGTNIFNAANINAEGLTGSLASQALSAMAVDPAAGAEMKFTLTSDNPDATGEYVAVTVTYFEKVIATDVLMLSVYG